MSFESVGQNKSLSENVTKETSTSPLQDTITPIVTPMVQQPPPTSSTNPIFQTSSKSRNTYQFHSRTQSAGLNNSHLRRWHSSNSGLHHSKSTTFGSSNSGNDDDIRTIYERWKLVLPKDDLIFDQYSSSVDRIEKKEAKRSLKWALWVSSNKFVKKSGKFGCSSYVFPWDKK
ncbi:15828_t:CDS:2, partial [Racocetra persica]